MVKYEKVCLENKDSIVNYNIVWWKWLKKWEKYNSVL